MTPRMEKQVGSKDKSTEMINSPQATQGKSRVSSYFMNQLAQDVESK